MREKLKFMNHYGKLLQNHGCSWQVKANKQQDKEQASEEEQVDL